MRLWVGATNEREVAGAGRTIKREGKYVQKCGQNRDVPKAPNMINMCGEFHLAKGVLARPRSSGLSSSRSRVEAISQCGGLENVDADQSRSPTPARNVAAFVR